MRAKDWNRLRECGASMRGQPQQCRVLLLSSRLQDSNLNRKVARTTVEECGRRVIEGGG